MSFVNILVSREKISGIVFGYVVGSFRVSCGFFWFVGIGIVFLEVYFGIEGFCWLFLDFERIFVFKDGVELM